MKHNRLKLGAAIVLAACLCATAFFFAAPAVTPDTLPTWPGKTTTETSQANGTGRTAANESATTESAAAENLPDSLPFEPGYALAILAEGQSVDDVLHGFEATPALAGISVADVSDELVSLALPEGLGVEEAVELIAQNPAVQSAQPDYVYELASDQNASAALMQDSIDATNALVAGTLLGEALETQASAIVNDPEYSSQWALSSMNAATAWKTVKKTKTTYKPTIAVIDDGFLISHEDLKKNVISSYDAVNSRTGLTDADAQEHGTHAAGIAAARANNGKGIAGASYNRCNVLPIKAQNDEGKLLTSTLVKAFKYISSKASTYNIRVASMSLGVMQYVPMGRSADPALYDAIDATRNKGVVSVVAACNGNILPLYAYPSDFDNVIGVISLVQTSSGDKVARASSSNYNRKGQLEKEISAPGEDIISLGIATKSSYTTKSGTSMATPAVAGVLGLMFAADKSLTPDEATSKLFSSARDITKAAGTGTGWDAATGFGEVDAAAAVSATTPYLSGGYRLARGSSERLTVKINGKAQPASGWKWKSSNTSVVRVSGGLITGIGEGDAIVTATNGSKKAVQRVSVTSDADIYWLISKKTGEYLYTANPSERDALKASGWSYKGVAWKAPQSSSVKVYRLYSSKLNRHRFVASASQRKTLMSRGWSYEGVAWYGSSDRYTPIYRYYSSKYKTYRYSTSSSTPSGWTREATQFYAE